MRIKFEDKHEEISYYNDEYVKLFKQAIKRRRKELGLTQDRLAEMVGLRQPAISRLENENYPKINLETVQRVVDGLDCVLKLELEKRTEVAIKNEESS
jgi:transcriptional regulator with XRE-family HTH domain